MPAEKTRVVAAAEIAQMLGVGTARVHVITGTDPTFPEPLGRLRVGKIWDAADVEDWMRRTGRTAPRQTTS